MATRFLTYVQSPLAGPPFDQPERLELDLSFRVRPGPSDDQVYVLDAIKRRYPNTPGAHVYDRAGGRPWGGAKHPPVEPGPDGHFDHLVPGTRPFAAASVYATVRFVLGLWDAYFADVGGEPVEWHHRPQPGVDGRLELNPWSLQDGARAGYGFVEIGTGIRGGQFNHSGPLWSNFDVIAHELGHSIVFGKMKFPANMTLNTEWYSVKNKTNNRDFLAFHESCGDLVAIVSSLHHRKVVNYLLANAGDNLAAANIVSNVGELGKRSSIRYASNGRKMSEFGGNPADTDVHALSEVLTGAVYAAAVDAYRDARRKKSAAVAVGHARDWLGRVLAGTWSQLSPDGLTFLKVRDAMIEADAALKGNMEKALVAQFRSRGIS